MSGCQARRGEMREAGAGEKLLSSAPAARLLVGVAVGGDRPGAALDEGPLPSLILRGLAARPPYFHNGLAADLNAVVDFYNERFAIGLLWADVPRHIAADWPLTPIIWKISLSLGSG